MSKESLHFNHEDRLAENTSSENAYIVGVDEVGYGAWAGSIVVAAVWINREQVPDDCKRATRDFSCEQ